MWEIITMHNLYIVFGTAYIFINTYVGHSKFETLVVIPFTIFGFVVFVY